MREGILLFGSLVADVHNLIDRWPEQDTVAKILHTEVSAGGPPCNCAADLVKLEAPFPVSLRGVLGDDAYGRQVLDICIANGLDVSGIRQIPACASPHSQVMAVEATGRRTFFYNPGANARILAEEFAFEVEPRSRIFYAGSPALMPGLDTPPPGSKGWPGLFERARVLGYKTVMEMVSAGREENRRIAVPCLPHLDYLIVNDVEASALTGLTLDKDGAFDWLSAMKACEALLDAGVSEVAAIHHHDGGVALRRGGGPLAAGSRILPESAVKSAVGAGDAFCAGFLLGLHEDWTLEACLELANASAAVSLRSLTTSGSVIPWRDALAYARQFETRAAGF
jgi:sugar/nucleoside kinase (ribokinase family)